MQGSDGFSYLTSLFPVNFTKNLVRSLLRIVTLLGIIFGGLFLGYSCWSPGKEIVDGRHDRGTNGIWLQHGWLGDDHWFDQHQRDKAKFRNPEKIKELSTLLSSHGFQYAYPHLCPCDSNGRIARVDPIQTEQFLNEFEKFKILPWVGGVLDVHCFPESAQWRSLFIESIKDLLLAHPKLAGIHINIEPMPSGNRGFITLLQELRKVIPPDKLVSIAAYPPPTRWHPFPDLHWDEGYFKEVSANSDQLAVMMYDTSLRWQKIYQNLMRQWTMEALTWGSSSKILLGVPAYQDVGVGYHDPNVENLHNSLPGIHAGLSSFNVIPTNYQGVAIYCEWEMDGGKWDCFENGFLNRNSK